MANQQKDTLRSDTASPGGAQPVPGQPGKVGSEVAGKTGGTDAAVASVDDSRTGTSSGEGASLTGGDPGSGKVPPPTNKGGASSA